MFHIYHLVDPATRAVRYVGTTQNPRRRLAGHIAESKKRQNTEKKAWIFDLLRRGMQPVFIVVATAETETAARDLESRQCHKHLATIFNMHDPRKGAKDVRPGLKKETDPARE